MPTSNASIFNQSVVFSCIASDSDSGLTGTQIEATQWRTTLCQLGEGGNNLSAWSGGLVSEFQPLAPVSFSLPGAGDEPSCLWGVEYLVLNITNGTWIGWAGATDTPQTPQTYEERGSWLDLAFADGNLILSPTLCYASFMTVKISSTTNRTEPIPVYDFATSKYIYPTVRSLLGQNRTSSQSQRGVLNLESQRDSWLAKSSKLPPMEPYIRDFANIGGPQGSENSGNYSASLWSGQGPSAQTIMPYMSWFRQIRPLYSCSRRLSPTGGSVAFALQSLCTILASVACYVQLGQFDNTGLSDVSDFVTVNAPVDGLQQSLLYLFTSCLRSSYVHTLF